MTASTLARAASSQRGKERCGRCARLVTRPDAECPCCRIRRLLPPELFPYDRAYLEAVACLATVRLIAECAAVSPEWSIVSHGIGALTGATQMLEIDGQTRRSLQEVLAKMTERRLPLRDPSVVQGLNACRAAWEANGQSLLASAMDTAFYAYGIPT